MELTLTADQVARQNDGAWLITMEGETLKYHDSICGGNDLGWWWSRQDADELWHRVERPDLDEFTDATLRTPRRKTRPPSGLVALLQPCPTCDGVGHLGPATGAQQKDFGRACPDCVNGRLVFDLRVPCDDLEGCGGTNVDPTWDEKFPNAPLDGIWSDELKTEWQEWFDESSPICPFCDDGTVSVRVYLDPEWGVQRLRSVGELSADAHLHPDNPSEMFVLTIDRLIWRWPEGCDNEADAELIGTAPAAAEVGWGVARAVEVET